MNEGSAEEWRLADEEVQKNLPPGVKLVRTLRGHTDAIGRIAWSPDGRMLASPSDDTTIRLWDFKTGKCIRVLKRHKKGVSKVAYDPAGSILASGGFDGKINLWDPASGKLIRELDMHRIRVMDIAFDPAGSILASGGFDGKINLWNPASGKLIRMLEGHGKGAMSVAFDPAGSILASGGFDGRIKLWDPVSGKLIRTLEGRTSEIPEVAFDPQARVLASSGGAGSKIEIWDPVNGRLLRILEGHTGWVTGVRFFNDGRLIASKGLDGIRLWRTKSGNCVAYLQIKASGHAFTSLAFHPYLPFLATVSSDPSTLEEERDNIIHIWELDVDVLLGQPTTSSVTYTSAKVVLVGDSGVGKTGLGWRLAHGEFKEHSSTHGMQFWVLNQLCKQRLDGAQCEAVLWDLAGQPDYRITHALFLDDVDLALVLFDPTRNEDLLSGVEFWLKQLNVENRIPSGKPTILIAARSDRGALRLTREELSAFCQQHGIAAFLLTSAKSGEGIKELIQQMHAMIPWEEKPATVTTETFKRIKDFVLNLKEDSCRVEVILTIEELRHRLEKTDLTWKFSDAEMLTAAGHLANHGYVTRLKTSQGELRVLLVPELLRNLAASFVLEARRNQKGLGSLEEQLLLSGGYKFPELEKLTEAEKDILLDSAVVLFLEHNVCFREIDPLNGRAYLVFPELINLKKLLIIDDIPTEDGVAYTVSGAVENVYASLVVLMGYTQTFTRTNQWRDHARYEVGTGHVCGFRLEAERAGEMDFVLYFGTTTPFPVRTLFQGLFESFLARRNLTVRRYEPVVCSKGHPLNRAVVREQMSGGAECAFCSRCGERIRLPKADQPIQLTKRQAEEVEANRRAADQRSRFERALFLLKNYVTEQDIAVPDCFISYAWGNLDQEFWVERRLATDLQKAGIRVVLDRWHNPPGSSIGRFIDRLEKADRIIAVGTIAYRKKYDNEDPESGTVVAAECAQINTRMRGVEKSKATIIPVLLEGTGAKSFPPCLSDQVFSDFRKPEAYFDKALELILSLYQIPLLNPLAMELRESLMSQKER
jgi:small GTP-binding protein